MCGISGIISLSGQKLDNIKDRIEVMSNLLDHRGPDQKGVFISEDQNFGLCNNRLSIVAPDQSFKLPFTLESQYSKGDKLESRTDFKPAKCITNEIFCPVSFSFLNKLFKNKTSLISPL